MVTAAAALALAASAAAAETVKIGFISSYSGLNADQGEYMERRDAAPISSNMKKTRRRIFLRA